MTAEKHTKTTFQLGRLVVSCMSAFPSVKSRDHCLFLFPRFSLFFYFNLLSILLLRQPNTSNSLCLLFFSLYVFYTCPKTKHSKVLLHELRSRVVITSTLIQPPQRPFFPFRFPPFPPPFFFLRSAWLLPSRSRASSKASLSKATGPLVYSRSIPRPAPSRSAARTVPASFTTTPCR